MSIEGFKQRPFHNHTNYDNSCFSMGQQPEYSTGDVLLASCYRVLGLARTAESRVNLEDIDQLSTRLQKDSIPITAWEFIFKRALRSPRRMGERTTKPLPQLVPLVPALGNFSGVLGRPRSRWNPGMLALYTIASGVGPESFPSSISSLFHALDTIEHEDDEFAWFLERKLRDLRETKRPGNPPEWHKELDLPKVIYRDQQQEPWSPAEVFARDLNKLLLLKPSLTRRQWCALLESLLRIGLVSHVLWICSLNTCVWNLALEMLEGYPPPSGDAIEKVFWSKHVKTEPFLDGGQNADPYLRRQIESYATARLGLNMLFYVLEEQGTSFDWPEAVSNGGLAAGAQIEYFLEHLSQARSTIGLNPRSWVTGELGTTIDNLAANRGINLSGDTKGVPKNLYEFLAYTLQRRRTKEVALLEHDQGYLLAKASSASNSPWVVRPGPVLLLTMCHVTCASMAGAPVTLRHLADHFGYYGVRLATGDLQEGLIATDLETLGVLVDSPDAGGGRLVLDPFRGVTSSG